MRNRTIRMTTAAVVFCLLFCICFGAPAFAQEALPQPGTTIDKSNYLTYKDAIPEVFLDAFTTGWELIDPLTITIKKPVDNPVPKGFLDASEKNRGKYSLDAEGYITGGEYKDIIGYPFPGITPADKDFATKFMWNFDYRYRQDDAVVTFMNFEKRRGSSTTISVVENTLLSFQGRIFDDPKPLLETTNGLRSAIMLRVLYPPVQKNFINLMIRYIDQRIPDDMYVYLPSMRRVLRGEAGQRSTPINSSTQAPDDFEGFSGRIPEFNFKFIGEKKLIVLGDAQLGYTEMKDKKFENVPVEMKNWMVKDVYVIDVIPKDDKYPQGRKRLWVDKETLWPFYTAAWDRAGNLWKVWMLACNPHPAASGGTVPYMKGMLGLDIQLGYVTNMYADWKLNGNGLTEGDIDTSAMRKKAR